MDDDTIESQAAKIEEFMTKRGAIMRGMAAELSAAETLDADAEPRPHVEKMLSLIDSLDIDAKDKHLLSKRILLQASDIFKKGDGVGEEDAGKALPEDAAYSDYEYYLFVLMIVLVLSVFGKIYV